MIEYIIIIFLFTVVILLSVLFFNKKQNDLNVVDRMNSLEKSVTKDLCDFKLEFSKYLKDDFENLSNVTNKMLDSIDNKVNKKLDTSFEKTNETFINVIERLNKIDATQKKIENLSSDIINLQSILTDKKTRGIFGEFNLNMILKNVFGEKNDKVYKIQYHLPNGTIPDAILFAPNPLGTIVIDSKFPLEHYEKMTNKNLLKSERDLSEKAFKLDVKKHIDAVSSKYIISGVTSNQAIMFLPAEAIFAEINAYHTDLLNYAYSKKVWITSPTTLMSTLTIISMVLKDIERDKYAKIIHGELNKLGDEFKRYNERWNKLYKSIDTLNKDASNIKTTTEKISKRFEQISNVDIKEENLLSN